MALALYCLNFILMHTIILVSTLCGSLHRTVEDWRQVVKMA